MNTNKLPGSKGDSDESSNNQSTSGGLQRGKPVTKEDVDAVNKGIQRSQPVQKEDVVAVNLEFNYAQATEKEMKEKVDVEACNKLVLELKQLDQTKIATKLNNIDTKYLRRKSIKPVTDPKDRERIAGYAKQMIKAKWPGYTVTGLQVICIIGDVTLFAMGVASFFLGVGIPGYMILKPIVEGIRLGKDTWAAAIDRARLLPGETKDQAKQRELEGLQLLQEMSKTRMESAEGLQAYRLFREVAALRQK